MSIFLYTTIIVVCMQLYGCYTAKLCQSFCIQQWLYVCVCMQLYVYASLSDVIQLNCVNLSVTCYMVDQALILPLNFSHPKWAYRAYVRDVLYASFGGVIHLNCVNLSVYNDDCKYVWLYVCVCVIEWCYRAELCQFFCMQQYTYVVVLQRDNQYQDMIHLIVISAYLYNTMMM